MFKRIIPLLFLLISLMYGPSLAGAQDVPQNQPPPANQPNQPGAITDGQTGFNWWWLLPLLIIPLFFFFRYDKDEEYRDEYQDQRLAGTKGGKTRTYSDLDEDENL
jgi:hypothetical protein